MSSRFFLISVSRGHAAAAVLYCSSEVQSWKKTTPRVAEKRDPFQEAAEVTKLDESLWVLLHTVRSRSPMWRPEDGCVQRPAHGPAHTAIRGDCTARARPAHAVHLPDPQTVWRRFAAGLLSPQTVAHVTVRASPRRPRGAPPVVAAPTTRRRRCWRRVPRARAMQITLSPLHATVVGASEARTRTDRQPTAAPLQVRGRALLPQGPRRR
mmetsp:Transcript_20407/g.64440  ORF Transcript_20407/g.64440 Transcript_20407/m.64440 type:complete len:210 (+) Transcript_20407:102-731(+)